MWNLVDVVQLEVLEQQQQQCGDGLDDDFLVTVHVDSQLHALKDCDTVRQTHIPDTNCKSLRFLRHTSVQKRPDQARPSQARTDSDKCVILAIESSENVVLF